MVLIPNKKINSALSNLNKRNQLIRELDGTSNRDPLRLYKLIMDFWLGSHIARTWIDADKYEEFRNQHRFLHNGYLLFLAWDKQLNIQDKHSNAYKVINYYQRQLMRTFNENYQLADSNFMQLYQLFHTVLSINAPNADLNRPEQQMIEQTRQLCLNELATVLRKGRDDALNYTFSSELFRQIPNGYASLDVLINRMVTISTLEHPYFKLCRDDRAYHSYHFHKIFTRSTDGVVLDGLHVKKIGQTSNSIVLTLIGHFPVEVYYISNAAKEYHQLFGTDVFFINHRNFASRANHCANSITELAADVVSFVKYFHPQKNIILYGMCGGSAQIIMAAQILAAEQIPFKLIIDRFPGRYRHFFDLKTVREIRKLGLNVNQGTDLCGYILSSYFLSILLFLAISIFVNLILRVGDLDIDFASIVQTFPPDDVLILQGKSKKVPQLPRPLCTDIIVHPENDTRHLIKNRRLANKSILHQLENAASTLACLTTDPQLKRSFLNMSTIFNRCLGLIQDEKLQLPHLPQTSMCIHSNRLFDLTTRNHTPVAHFIQGFFKAPQHPIKRTLSKLEAFPEARIMTVIANKHENIILPANKHSFAQHFSTFLTDLKTNADYVNYMTNRLFNTGLGNFYKILIQLIDSKLYQSLTETSEHQPGSSNVK